MSEQKTIRSRVLTIVAAAAFGLTAYAALAQSVTLRVASSAPEKSVWTTMLKAYKDRVAELSKGDINIEIYPNAELGAMDDTLSQTLHGRIDIYTGSLPYLSAVVPELSVLQLPYLFDSNAQSICVMSKLSDDANTAMAGKAQFIGFVPVGWMNISSKKDVRVPADLAGEKMRSNPLNVSNILLKAYGANPVPISPAETASALSTGLVSGGDNALAFWASTGQSQQSKHYLLVQHYLNTSAIIIGKRSWDKLSDAQKKAMEEATDAIAYPKLVKMLDGFEQKVVAKVTSEGATVTTPTPEQMAEWRKVGLGTWNDILKGADGRTLAFLEKVKALKAGCQ